jgi:drug/metabolite transporter (DMT)-like permease
VNRVEIEHLRADPQADLGRYAIGALLAACAVVCWTWYPMRNARWLRLHAHRSSRSWATAQGVATLPLALIGNAAYALWNAFGSAPFPMPFGPRATAFVGLMLVLGFFASWLGTLCWNEASQRLPTTVSGQLIVFETLAALGYAFVLRGQAPTAPTLAGVLLLVAGVVWALRARPAAAPP